MKLKFVVTVLCCLMGVALGARLSSEQAISITNRHNHWRDVDTGGKAPPLTWNSDLAKVASDYADKCLLAHNARRSIEYDAMIGENIYFTSVDITKRNDLASPVDYWDAEKKYYNYDTLSCSKPACGHYTQVVWANTKFLGCGMNYCPALSYSGLTYKGYKGTLIVCNYDPTGNYKGQRPYQTEKQSLLEALLQTAPQEQADVSASYPPNMGVPPGGPGFMPKPPEGWNPDYPMSEEEAIAEEVYIDE